MRGSMISQIELDLNELPESEKKVAEYILANAKEVLHMTIHELATKAEASSAAVVRFLSVAWNRGLSSAENPFTRGGREHAAC